VLSARFTFDSRLILYKIDICRIAASCPISGLQGGSSMHNVVFDDTDANWLAWGTLVRGWIFNNPPNRPNNVATLRTQMQNAGITGIVLQGAPTRPVQVQTYNSASPGPIVIPVPTQTMVTDDENYLNGIAPAPYPVPSFYSAIFGGSPRVTLTSAMLLNMAHRRLGEYVINECM
jgi:hypothetical protein